MKQTQSSIYDSLYNDNFENVKLKDILNDDKIKELGKKDEKLLERSIFVFRCRILNKNSEPLHLDKAFECFKNREVEFKAKSESENKKAVYIQDYSSYPIRGYMVEYKGKNYPALKKKGENEILPLKIEDGYELIEITHFLVVNEQIIFIEKNSQGLPPEKLETIMRQELDNQILCLDFACILDRGILDLLNKFDFVQLFRFSLSSDQAVYQPPHLKNILCSIKKDINEEFKVSVEINFKSKKIK